MQLIYRLKTAYAHKSQVAVNEPSVRRKQTTILWATAFNLYVQCVQCIPYARCIHTYGMYSRTDVS